MSAVSKPLALIGQDGSEELVQDDDIWDGERSFGLRLRVNGIWERHPTLEAGSPSRIEESEPKKGSIFDEISGYGDEKPTRTLTNFALYDENGRLIPVEALEIESFGKIIAFGSLVHPKKDDPRHPVPPPAEKWKDTFAEAVLNQPLPQNIPSFGEEDDYGLHAKAKILERAKSFLDTLLGCVVNQDVLRQTGLGMIVNRLRRHEEIAIQYRAVSVKRAWTNLLDRGGSDASCIDLEFLKVATVFLTEFANESSCMNTPPPSFHIGCYQIASLNDGDDGLDGDMSEPGGGNDSDKKRARSSVNSAEIIAEYVWNGQAVEPTGPQEQRLKQMVDYVRELLQCGDEELKGWRMAVHRRKKGNAFGQMDSYFFSPEGRRYRSRNEVGKAFEAGTFGQGRTRGLRLPSSGTPSSTVKRTDSSKPPVISPLSSMPAIQLPMPQMDDVDNMEVSYARRPFFEFADILPLKPLTSLAQREFRTGALNNNARMKSDDVQGQANTRVRLELIGWAISSENGASALYVYTETAAYRLAGDLVTARPATYYHSFFCSSFLSLDACRLVARTFTDYGPILPASRLGLAEVLQDVISQSQKCPGHSSDPLNRLIVPASSIRYFYYPSMNRLSADFIVARYPLIHAIVARHFQKNPSTLNSAPFFSELSAEYEKRSRLDEKNFSWALQDEQRRRANEKRKALRIETKERERVHTLLKRLEVEGDLRPDDGLLIRATPSEVANRSSSDPLMVQAIEKFLSSSPMPAELRPTLTPLEFDPALLDGSHLLNILEKGTTPEQKVVDSPLLSGPSTLRVQLNEVERALLSGKLAEVPPVAIPEDLGETFSRLLQIWEGSRHFAQAKGKVMEEAVGSFPGLRRQVYESCLTSTLFVDMLKAIAQEDLERRNPPTASVDDLCYHLMADPIFDSAFDQSVWPPPLWVINENTWACLLWSAMADWLRYNPEVAAFEMLECGEVSGSTQEEVAKEAGLALREQAAPKDLDYIALCDDGLRGLMLDPDAEEFCQPVDRSIFPDYDQVIPRPMDLGTIRERIAAGHYDPRKSPVGAYVWDSEKFSIGRKLDTSKTNAESDDDEDDDEKPSFNLLALLADYRSGGSLTERQDCGKCKHCLDKPRFGGYNTLRQPCKLKQQAEQLQSATVSRDAAKKIKTKDLWKRRQAALAKEEAMAKFDEMYFAHDSLGGGHEGLSADVRQVFRNCRVYNKGTTPIYRAASKLDAMFNAFYLRMIASRDPKYAVPRNLGFPDALIRDARMSSPLYANGESEEHERLVVPRIRRGFPSVIATVKALAETKNWAIIPLKFRIVALGWLVDRALDTTKLDYLNNLYSTVRAAPDGENAVDSQPSPVIEPLGLTRDFLRVWAVPHLIRETGGLVLFENLQSGQWSFLDELSGFEAFVMSLDTRGRREWNLKRNLERHRTPVEAALKEANREFILASQQLKTAESERLNAQTELEKLSAELPAVEEEAKAAKKLILDEAEARHQEEEAARRKEFDEKKKQWAEAWTDDNKRYYYHVETRVTTWSRPKEMDLVFSPKPSPTASQTSSQEIRLNLIKERINELNNILEDCDAKVARARVEVCRDRAVFSWVRKLKVDKRICEIQPNQGLFRNIVSLVSSIQALERFCLGAKGGSADSMWESKERREQWISGLNETVKNADAPTIAHTIEACMKSIRNALITLAETITSAGPFADHGNLVNQRMVHEKWRWLRHLDESRTLSELAISVAHLRRFFGETLASPEALLWEQTFKAKVGNSQ